jgi:hypothetical protein
MDTEQTYDTFTLTNPITSRRLRRLCRRLDDCLVSDDYVVVIGQIARTGDEQAIEVLSALLDSSGSVGRAAMDAIVGFGPAAVPEMQRVVRDSMDGAAIAHAEQVLDRILSPEVWAAIHSPIAEHAA